MYVPLEDINDVEYELEEETLTFRELCFPDILTLGYGMKTKYRGWLN